MIERPTLHMMCGKIAAGKSTLSAKLGEASNTIVISEDHWVDQLYPGEIKSVADFFRRSERLRTTLTPHIVDLLRAGVSVVLDFHANTVASRLWMRSLFEEAHASHELHLLDVPDEVCRERMHARNAALADDDFATNDADFDHVTSFFVAPDESEGFNVIRHGEG
jgi:predicted kinase